MESGAQPGNDNAKRGFEYRLALRKAMAREHGTTSEGLEKVAKKLVEAAENGEQWAIKEIADRFDGKSSQSIVLSEDPENPIGKYAGLGGLYPGKPDPTEDGGSEGESE